MGFIRLDVFFTLWFYFVTCRSGLIPRLPAQFSIPWRPTWAGYMKPASTAAMNLVATTKQTFENLENEHFSGFPRQRLSIPVLRIHGENDPIVRPEVLCVDGLERLEFWWTSR